MLSALEFTVQTAREAGQLLLEYYHSATLRSQLKPDKTLVTEADVASDNLISQAIQKSYPGDLLLSEELQTTLSDDPTGHAIWVIDPLDGTTNFSLGLAFWGVLIARLEKGFPILAAMYFPVLDELYTVQKGSGAWLNGDPLLIDSPRQQMPITFFSCCSRTFRRFRVSVPYKTRILGSAAYTLCSIARGASLLGFETTCKIWDFSGGWLLVQEAGGQVETFDLQRPFPLQHGINYAKKSFPIISASTSELIAQARQQIVPL